jgi:hypothetical protein
MKVPGFVSKAAFSLGKHSPTILVAVGVAGVIASAVGACMATRKLDEVMEMHEKRMNAANDEENVPDEKERQKLKYAARMATGWDMIKLYALPTLGLIASVTCIIGAQVILRRRNAILSASLLSATKAFDEYRKRVADRFGDEVERQIHYNMIPDGDPVTVIDMDENGKAHKSKVQNFAIDPSIAPVEDNIIYFTRNYSPLWKDDDVINEHTIEQIIQYVIDAYDKTGHVFVNDIRSDFAVDGTIGGQALGYSAKTGKPDIRYSATRFMDPTAPSGSVAGYVIEIVGATNILDDVFSKQAPKLIPA